MYVVKNSRRIGWMIIIFEWISLKYFLIVEVLIDCEVMGLICCVGEFK